MAIEIIEPVEPTVKLTSEEYAKYHREYQDAFMFYSGMPPTFEQWVRGKLTGLTESKQLLVE